MDHTFYYILASWESFGHNNWILEDILFNKNFRIPNKKYYLANVGYYNIDYFLYLYCGVCYHLKKQAAIRKKPINKEELFNFSYFSL